MASASLSATPSSLPSTPSASSPSPHDRFTRVSFPLALQKKKKPLPSIKGGRTASNGTAFARKAQLSEIVGEAFNDTAASVSKPGKGDDAKKEEPLPEVQISAEAVVELMNQVSSLVSLVDSKDVVELHLKQPGCELIIRKKEALKEPPAPQVMMMPAPGPSPVAPYAYSAPPYAPAPPQPAPSPSTPAPAAPAPVAQLPKSTFPPFKSPMAGTFYRSPQPGEPPYVKVGDKVQTGQVLCIIEAMKLFNEIEADHSGTITEIFLDDGKPVGVGQPMFVIQP